MHHHHFKRVKFYKALQKRSLSNLEHILIPFFLLKMLKALSKLIWKAMILRYCLFNGCDQRTFQDEDRPMMAPPVLWAPGKMTLIECEGSFVGLRPDLGADRD